MYKHVQYVIEKQELAFLRQIREFRVPIFPYASLAGKKVSSYFAVTYCVQTWSVVTFVRAETWLNVERVHAHTCMRQKGITIVCVCVCVCTYVVCLCGCTMGSVTCFVDKCNHCTLFDACYTRAIQYPL